MNIFTKSSQPVRPLQSILDAANTACANKDYFSAEKLCKEAIEIDGANPAIYANLSVIHYYLQNYHGAQKNAEIALNIDPSFELGYYQLGAASQQLQQYNNALIAFAKGMSLDSKNFKFLKALIDTALKSSLRESLQPILNQLLEMNLERNPFVVVSVIGQDLLAHNYAKEAIEILECAIKIGTSSLKLKGSVCSALSSALWTQKQYEKAIVYMEEDWKVSQALGDILGEVRACGNLAAAYFHLNKLEDAFEYYEKQLLISENLQAQGYDLKQLQIFRSIADEKGEKSTHENLAAAYQALVANKNLQEHHASELAEENEITKMSKTFVDLANFYNSVKQYESAIGYYDKYLALSSQVTDTAGHGKVLYNLGFAYFSLRDYVQAVTYYEQSAAIAKESRDMATLARAYCNLGLASKSLGDLDLAFQYQCLFLELSNELNSVRGQFKALGNLADLCVVQKQFKNAEEYYEKQLKLSEAHNDPLLIAQACSSLGSALRHTEQFAKALEMHSRECEIYQTVIRDEKNEFKAQGRRGATLTALEHYTDAIACYERQLEISQSMHDLLMQTQAWANLAITYSNLSDYESAKQALQNKIDVLNELDTKSARVEKCKAYCSVGDCYSALEQHKAAIEHFQTALFLACELKNLALMEQSCTGASYNAQSFGDTKSAIVWAKHRVKICERMRDCAQFTAAAYGELAYLYSSETKFTDAIFYLNKQMEIAVEVGDDNLKSDTACGLGSVYLLMKDFEKALTFHKLDLELAQAKGNRLSQGRAYENIAASYEAMKGYALAIPCREQHLFIAKEQNDEVAKLVALHGIGRDTLQLPNGDYHRAVLLLQQAMLLCHGVKRNDKMIEIIYDLAMATWACGDLSNALAHMYKAVEIAEQVCYESYSSINNRLSQDFLEFYKLLIKCYSSIICLLCSCEKAHEALSFAEKSKSLIDRIFSNNGEKTLHDSFTATEMLDFASKHNCAMLCYHITAGFLFQWCITPAKGIFFVGVTNLMDESKKSIFGELWSDLLNALGVANDNDEYDNDSAQQRSNSEENNLFLKLVSAGNSCDFDNSHISTGKGCLLQNTAVQTGNFKSKSPYYNLYEFLLSRAEKECGFHSYKQLFIVADGDLFLAPFAMLKKRSVDKVLAEQHVLNILPSFYFAVKEHRINYGCQRCIAISAGLQSSSLSHRSASEEEARIVGRVFGVEPISGTTSNKSQIASLLGSSKILHFACTAYRDTGSGISLEIAEDIVNIEHDLPDFATPVPPTPCHDIPTKKTLISSSDFLNCDLSATKLLVLGAPFLLKTEKSSKAFKFGKDVSMFIRSLLCRGCGAVLLSLWPVPETASKVFFQTFYQHLSEGNSTTEAYSSAVNTLRCDTRFEHPSYWAGFVLIGQETRLDSDNVALVHALVEILKGPPALASEAIKLLIHLIDKSMKKDSGDSAPTFVSQETVSSRVQDAPGWRSLLTAAYFDLRPCDGNIPDAVFFPSPNVQAEVEKLTQILRPFLGLSPETLRCFGSLALSPFTAKLVADWLDGVLERHCQSSAGSAETAPEYAMDYKMWQTDGVFDLLSSLRFASHQVSPELFALHLEKSTSTELIQSVVTCLRLLFGHTSETSLEIKETRTHKLFVSLEKPLDNSCLFSDMLNKILLDLGSDQQDLNPSLLSEESSNEMESSSNVEEQVLPFDEPKTFTQIPEKENLIAPKPLAVEKPRTSTPENLPSARGGGFSPYKKFTFAPFLGKTMQTDLFLESPKSNPIRPFQSPTSSRSDSKQSLSNIIQNGDPKVCVVSPQGQRELTPPRMPVLPDTKYMSVFESMLAGSGDASRHNFQKTDSKFDQLESRADLNQLKDTSSGSSSSYKPSPSAANSMIDSSVKHEYSQIADKLTHRNLTSTRANESESSENMTTSNSIKRSTQHTAFRLINQSDPKLPPKLQKYTVETQIRTDSFLVSENSEISLPPVKSQKSTARRRTPPRPTASSGSIFRQLEALNMRDDQAKFV